MGFKKGHTPWNRGLTAATDPRVADVAKKIGLAHKGRHLSKEHKRKISEASLGKTGWSKGLTKETNASVAKMAQALTGRNLSEEHKKAIGEGGRGKTGGWMRGLTKFTDQRVALLGKKISALAQAKVREKLRVKYNISKDEHFIPAGFAEHVFARSLVTGSKAPAPVSYLTRHPRTPMRFKGDTESDLSHMLEFPVKSVEYGIVNGKLVPLIVVFGVTRVAIRTRVNGL